MKTYTAVIALVLVVLSAWPAAAQRGAPRADPNIDPKTVLRSLEDAFTSVADRVTPAVVNVSSLSGKATAPGGEDPERFREYFGEEFYDKYFKRRPREDARASGSGVIVDPKGYILTNNHVVENAREITVRLSDARKFTATLVGRDPKTDLAVLKIDSPNALPVAEMGDSDRLKVGQWAIAIGNPFGLDRTVTVGIISATARTRVGVTTYENFIQTDASINPGNSGGPLLNLDGRVIGVNTAIVAAGQGIGFSIPINEARLVMTQLIKTGRVVRGWLGVAIQDVTDELATSFGVREREGVLIADVIKGGPADKAGVRPGDVVVEFNGTKIKEVPDLQRRVAGVAPGETVKLTVVRDKQPVSVSVAIGEMPSEETAVAAVERETEGLGMQVETLSPDASERLGLPFSQGLIVTDVASGGPADRAGLRRGDVILEVDRRPVTDLAALRRALAAAPVDKAVLLYLHRPGGGGRNQYVFLERGPKP
jgi:serine protease Do